jgi:hypothetical protein
MLATIKMADAQKKNIVIIGIRPSISNHLFLFYTSS